MRACADLELTIHQADQQYAVDFRFSDSDPLSQSEVRLGAGQAAYASFDFEKLKEHLEAGEITEYGQALTQGLFASEPLRTAFAQARAATELAGAILRVRLNIHPSARKLHSLLWETLSDPQSGLSCATDQNTYFSRYLAASDWRSIKPRPKGELKALAFIAAPNGLERSKLARVDKAAETATIASSLGSIQLKVLERATLNDLAAALTSEEYDILYLVAHGTFANEEARLWLEDEQGAIANTPGAELVKRIRELEKRPRLAVLASCQSAGKGEGEALAALGPRLAEAGIPAVLAMQSNVLMETVAKFMPRFFSELQADGQIDRALNVARGLVREQIDWWVPCLFMRLTSGRLWYTPGFGGPRGQFEKWPSLQADIKTGKFTPILGPGLLDTLLGSQRDLTKQWADELEYPLSPHERESLPQVAQYRAVNQSHATAESEWLKQMRFAICQRAGLPLPAEDEETPIQTLLETARAKLRPQDEFEPHKILAQMPAKVYITANMDELLETALREAGKNPKTMVCPWREFSDQTDPETYNRNDDYDPTPESPLVYHLFGLFSQPESLVLTEDDTFEFLIGITRHLKNIPTQVGRALADSGLLFLGFQVDEWNFRVLMQALLAKEGNNLLRRHAHIAAQIEPEEGRLLNPGRARRYLESYLAHGSEIEINIFWGTAREFMKELAPRLPAKKA